MRMKVASNYLLRDRNVVKKRDRRVPS